MGEIRRRAVLAALAALPLAGGAQQGPEDPVRLIVLSRVGGIPDLIGRSLAETLAPQLGRAVVVENRASAGGTIGMAALAKAAPDGSTLAFADTGLLTLTPALVKVAYDPEHDFTPIASVSISPLVLLATPATGPRDLHELLQRARDFPQTVRWGSAGLGSLGHILLEQLEVAAHVRMVHVPYKGAAQQLTDAIGGHFEVLCMPASPALADHVRAGRLRPLAVGSPQRLQAFPAVPTLAELGYPHANLAARFGLFAPANLPVRLLDRLNSTVNAALESPGLRSRMEATGHLPAGGTPREFAQQIAEQADRTGGFVRTIGLRLD